MLPVLKTTRGALCAGRGEPASMSAPRTAAPSLREGRCIGPRKIPPSLYSVGSVKWTLPRTPMRRAASAALAAITLWACRPYDNAAPLEDQKALIPAAKFARYGREQAEVVAIGRSLAAWKMTEDEAGLAAQAEGAGCFARRFADVETGGPAKSERKTSEIPHRL